MDKLISVTQAVALAKTLHKQRRKIVVTGGCFDILHLGHILLLEGAKKQGDVLFVLLESDESIRAIKGELRPINSQSDRARILASMQAIDYVILLPHFTSNEEYDTLVNQLKPAIIATTHGDPRRSHKERQAKLVGGQVVDVTEPLSNQSTSRLVNILKDL
jgi:rfaE bifunctional protein nucleotidyltransferase chain/domain